ncbi:type II secretion system protein [Roseiconus nitratireducens]|uniref:Type II secretion system protein n=1 Tax=Roseiconus nitratireducens TaxID=2605748 RepID=A0A5M6D0X4_9BACT|nr:type II secretion system protein [Roseiconus nitratireducens]KAA5540696.1 type II secretion system protein [Roseiconus nitratireducens]
MNRKQSTYRPSADRRGFTLVELLVVITIIGAIAALSIPAIGRVMRTVRQASMKAEMTNLASGIENYKTKYGDYPPDFSDWNLVKRHYLKIFPDIATTELNLLYRLCDDVADNDPTQLTATTNYNPAAMDRAEAVVWSLGGFSSDPQYPFTGAGGPLVAMPAPNAPTAPDDPAGYEYNPTRNSPEIEFDPARLSLVTFDPSATKSFTNRNQSDDDTYSPIDVFPTYNLREEASPVVYFDARTYAWNDGTTVFNGYVRQTNDSLTGYDGVRPVYSTVANNPPSGSYGTLAAAATGWQFAQPNSFQLLAPGLDGFYGEVTDADGGTNPQNVAPVYFQVDGGLIVLNDAASTPQALKSPNVSRFDITSIVNKSDNPFKDNMCNFIESTFENQLP